MSVLLLGLSADDRRRVGALLAGCPSLDLPAGATAGADDLPPATLLVVDEGTVTVARNAEETGRRIVLALAEPGDVLVQPGPDDRLTALSDARLTAVGRRSLRALLARPDAGGALLEALAEAVCDREWSLANLGRFPHVERVRAKLLQLARSRGKVSERGVLIDLPLTHELLADMVGSARETVTWAVRELLDEGFLSREGRLYRLHVAPGEIARDDRRLR